MLYPLLNSYTLLELYKNLQQLKELYVIVPTELLPTSIKILGDGFKYGMCNHTICHHDDNDGDELIFLFMILVYLYLL